MYVAYTEEPVFLTCWYFVWRIEGPKFSEM